jgi:hypothetical protein
MGVAGSPRTTLLPTRRERSGPRGAQPLHRRPREGGDPYARASQFCCGVWVPGLGLKPSPGTTDKSYSSPDSLRLTPHWASRPASSSATKKRALSRS